MSDVITPEQGTAAERAARDIFDKIEAATADLSPAQQERVKELARTAVAEASTELLANADAARYRAQPGEAEGAGLLRGTAYERMGIDLAGVELIHDIMEAGRARDPRLPGPNEKTRSIVEAARKQRSLDTAESGFGAQLVPDAIYVPAIWEAARQQYGTVMSLVESRPMSGPIEKHPVIATTPTMLFYGETTDAVASATAFTTIKPGTNEVTLTAKKFIGMIEYSGELVEDSLVPLVGLLNQALARSQAKTMDYLILNGDTTNAGTGNINLDDADPADTLYYLAADGVRHAALADNTSNAVNVGAAITYADLVKLPTLMLDRTYDQHWGRPDMPNDLVYVGTPELDNDILNLDEVVAAQAYQGRVPEVSTPLRGELLRIGRHPYYSHPGMGLTEADGKISTTANNNTLGQIACFNVRGLLMGTRRVAQLEVERHPRFDMWSIVLSTRVALGRYTPTGAASGIEWAAVAYNITNS